MSDPAFDGHVSTAGKHNDKHTQNLQLPNLLLTRDEGLEHALRDR